MYFWATGLLSSFLDNAPTYLVFFNLAGGDAQTLMTTGAHDARRDLGRRRLHGREQLYRQCAEFHGQGDRGVARRSHAGLFRVLGWSAVVLLPLFIVTGWLFF